MGAPLSTEDANMTAVFFSSAVTWSRALLDGKILDLVCSGDSTQACKVIWKGLLKGCCNVYPATLFPTPFIDIIPTHMCGYFALCTKIFEFTNTIKNGIRRHLEYPMYPNFRGACSSFCFLNR